MPTRQSVFFKHKTVMKILNDLMKKINKILETSHSSSQFRGNVITDD